MRLKLEDREKAVDFLDCSNKVRPEIWKSRLIEFLSEF